MQLSLIVPLGGTNPLGPQQLTHAMGASGVEYLLTASDSVPPAILRAWKELGFCVHLRQGPRGEGLRQMASEAKGDTLLFLHADTRLPPDWLAQVQTARGLGRRWGAFRLGFAPNMGVPHGPGSPRVGGLRRAGLGLVAWGANLRSRRGLPFGDQAPFFEKAFYLALGGHPSFDLMEDYVLSQRAAEVEPPSLLRGRVRTSPHRYLRHGILRTVLKNRSIIRAFERNCSPEELARTYYR